MLFNFVKIEGDRTQRAHDVKWRRMNVDATCTVASPLTRRHFGTICPLCRVSLFTFTVKISSHFSESPLLALIILWILRTLLSVANKVLISLSLRTCPAHGQALLPSNIYFRIADLLTWVRGYTCVDLHTSAYAFAYMQINTHVSKSAHASSLINLQTGLWLLPRRVNIQSAAKPTNKPTSVMFVDRVHWHCWIINCLEETFFL